MTPNVVGLVLTPTSIRWGAHDPPDAFKHPAVPTTAVGVDGRGRPVVY